MAAEGHVARCLARIETDLAFEPLPIRIDHRDVSDRHAKHSRRQLHNAIEPCLRWRIEYLQRLEGPALDRVREDMATLVAFARQEQWPKQLVQALKTFLDDYGIGKGEA